MARPWLVGWFTAARGAKEDIMSLAIGERGPVPALGTERDPSPPGRQSALRLALESALIVLSVLLAFGLNEWRMVRADRALADNVLTGLKREIAANLQLLEQYQPMHAQFAEAIAAVAPESLVGRTPLEVMSQLRSDGGSLIMPPGEAAWQTAVSTGALRLLDYETVAILSRIYLSQSEAVGRTTQRIADLVFDGRMFDRSASLQTVQTLLALLRELSAQEAWLMREYHEGLARLENLGI
jgi:hypothetical protein